MSEIKLSKNPIPVSPRAEKILDAQNSVAKSDSKPDAKSTAKIDSRDPKMLEAARSFENQFIRQIISEMRKTVPKDDLTGDSMTENIFREQLDNEYADSWVNQGGIGLADMIYDQLYEKYGHAPRPLPKAPGEVLPLAKKSNVPGAPVIKEPMRADHAARPAARPKDILAQTDKGLFLAKKEPGGFALKSREPLPETVGLRSPLSGVVLQAAALEDGREMVVVKHDQGLVSQFVHTGHNRVRHNMRVDAGEIIAELPPSKNGEGARVFFVMKNAL